MLDPRVVIIRQSGKRGLAFLRRPVRVGVQEPDHRPAQAAIADRVERLERLRSDLGVLRAEASSQDAAGFRGAEDCECRKGAVDQATFAPEQDGCQEAQRGVRRRRDPAGAALERQAVGPARRRPRGLVRGPGDDRVSKGCAMAHERLDRRVLCPLRPRQQHVEHAVRLDGAARQELRGSGPNPCAVVVERPEQRGCDPLAP